MNVMGIALRLAAAGAAMLVSCAAAAQIYRPAALDEVSNEPALVLSLSPAGIDGLSREFARELAGGKVGADRLAQVNTERTGPWVLYARFYVLNYQGNFSEHRFLQLDDSRVGFGRTGPAIAGRIYIGIRKRF
jgi:hypothetical protein